MYEGRTVDVVCFDFSKAFDTFFCDSLIEKLRKHGLSKLTEKWTESWMNFQLQMAALAIQNVTKSQSLVGSSAVSTWLILCNIFINVMGDWGRCTLHKLPHGEKLGGVVDTHHLCRHVDLHRPEKLTEDNLMKYNKEYAKYCTCWGKTLCTNTNRRITTWKVTGRKRPGYLGE